MKSIMLVFSDPVEGAEDEFNEWYDSTHIPEVLGIDGILSAQRFKLADGSPETANRYLAVYELAEGRDADVRQELAAARASGRLTRGNSIAPGSRVWLMSATTPTVGPSQADA